MALNFQSETYLGIAKLDCMRQSKLRKAYMRTGILLRKELLCHLYVCFEEKGVVVKYYLGNTCFEKIILFLYK